MPDRETTPDRDDLYGDNFSHGIILSMYLDGMTNCWNTVIKDLMAPASKSWSKSSRNFLCASGLSDTNIGAGHMSVL